jgi:hypothetical protein
MNKRKVVLFAVLASLLCVGGLLVIDSAAQKDPDWLPFDGASGPALPKLDLLGANPNSIDLQANLPGAQFETLRANGQTFTRLSGEGYGVPTSIGAPELPVLRHEVEFPLALRSPLSWSLPNTGMSAWGSLACTHSIPYRRRRASKKRPRRRPSL